MATTNATDAGLTLYRRLGRIAEHYNLPRGVGGTTYPNSFDYFRFLGHEMLTDLIACLLREERWGLITTVLGDMLYIPNRDDGTPGSEDFSYIAGPHDHLFRRRIHQTGRSEHALLLRERHSNEKLGALISFKEFIDADTFLFFRAEAEATGDPERWPRWAAVSTIYQEEPPVFLVRAVRKGYAEKLLGPLGVRDVETLRHLFVDRARKLRAFRGPAAWPGSILGGFDPKTVATK